MPSWSKVTVKHPIPAKSESERQVSNIIAESTTGQYAQRLTPTFRASSLPYCSILDTLATLISIKVEDNSMGHYSAIGTALHEYHQDRIAAGPHGSQVFGDWVCTNFECAKVNGEEARIGASQCLRPDSIICPACGQRSTPKYREMHLFYKGVLGCHPDLVLINPSTGKGRLIDFKTTEDYAVEGGGQYFPVRKHLIQLSTYVPALQEIGVQIEECFLVYVSRGRAPHKTVKSRNHLVYGLPMTPKLLRKRQRILDASIQANSAVRSFIKSRSESDLAEVIERRPCHDPQDYLDPREGMGLKFFGASECEFFSPKLGCRKNTATKAIRETSGELNG